MHKLIYSYFTPKWYIFKYSNVFKTIALELDRAQLRKHLLCKHDGLSFFFRTHIKITVVISYTFNHSIRKSEAGRCLGNADFLGPNSLKDAEKKNQSDGSWGMTSYIDLWLAHWCAYTWTCRYMHIHTQWYTTYLT